MGPFGGNSGKVWVAGAAWRRWRRRVAAVVGVAALAVPLWPAAVVAPPAAEGAGPPPALEWKNMRPPMTDEGDTTGSDGFRHLPDFGAVRHPMAVAPNGDLFVAGGGADVNVSGAGTCQAPTDAHDPHGSDPSGCQSATETHAVLYKSTDGGSKFRATYLTNGTPLGPAASSFIRKVVVSPQYPLDNFIAVVFSPQNFQVGVANASVATAHNGLAWSRDGGLGWDATMTGGDGFAPGNQIDWLTMALSPDFNWSDGTGVVAIGGQNEVGTATTATAAVSTLKANAVGGNALRWGAFTAVGEAPGPAVTATTLDLEYTPSQLPVALGRVASTATGAWGQVLGPTTWGALSGGGADEIRDGGAALTGARNGRVGFRDTYSSGGVWYVSVSTGVQSPATAGGVYRWNGTAWQESTPQTTFCAGGVTDLAVTGLSTSTILLASTTTSVVCRSTDDGASWTQAGNTDGGAPGSNRAQMNFGGAVDTVAWHRFSPNTVYFAHSLPPSGGAAGGGLIKSNDNGGTWADTGLTNEPFVISNYRAVDANNAFATANTAQSRAVFVTSNAGATAAWRRSLRYGVPNISLGGIPASYATDHTLFVADTAEATPGYKLLRSTNSGVSWQLVSLGHPDPFAGAPSPNETISTLRGGWRSGQRLWVGGSQGHVSHTLDGGNTWTLLAKDFGGAIGEFSFVNTSDTMFTVTAQDTDNVRKVWWTDDGGATFTQVGDAATAWGTGNPGSGNWSTITTLLDPATGNGSIVVLAPGGVSTPDVYTFDRTTVGGASWVQRHTDTTWLNAVSFSTPGVGDGLALYLYNPSNAPGSQLAQTVDVLHLNGSDWPQRQRLPVQAPQTIQGSGITGTTAVLSTCKDAGAAVQCLSLTARGQVVDLTVPTEFEEGPALLLPAPSASVPTNIGNDAVPAVLRWGPIAKASCYELQMSLDQNFNAPALDGLQVPMTVGGCGGGPGVSTSATYQLTSAVFALVTNQAYWWRVRVRATDASVANASFGAVAGNPGGFASPWSTPRLFVVVPVGTAFLTLSPTLGNPGWGVGTTGTLFVPSETVQLLWDTPATLLATAFVDGNGGFTAGITIPANASAGLHVVRAQGLSSGRVAGAGFMVTVPGAPAPSFQGKVKIGVPGGGEAAPPAGYQVQVFVHNTGVVTPLNTQLVQTDGGGVFAVTVSGLAAASYDVRVKGSHTISRKLTGAALPQAGGATPLDFGTLPTGDLSGDDAILGVDYSAMVSNFGLTGPLAVSGGGIAAYASNDAAPVRVRLATEAGAIDAGATFRVDVVVESGRPIDAMDVLLRYAPDRLVLVDADGRPASGARRGNDLPVVLRNRADAETGTLEFASGALPGEPVRGTLTVATLYFTALTPLTGDVLPLRLEYGGIPRTAAYYRGEAVPAQ